jgi:hypothetical protein
MVGDGQRPAKKPLKVAQKEAGIPPGGWAGAWLRSAWPPVPRSARQAELLFGEGRHPDADRIAAELLAAGDSRAEARRATVLGRAVGGIASPVLALDWCSGRRPP